MSICFIVPGEPIAKARPRFSRWGIYTEKKTLNYETFIKEIFVQKYPNFTPLETPLKIHLMAYLSIPSSISKKKMMKMKDGIIRPAKRPDIDNILKIFLDASQKLIFKNDNQLVEVMVEKYYSLRPRLDILIEEIKEDK